MEKSKSEAAAIIMLRTAQIGESGVRILEMPRATMPQFYG
jgi:hypothetical protein